MKQRLVLPNYRSKHYTPHIANLAMKSILFGLLAAFSVQFAIAATPGPQPKPKALPTVFVLGEYETTYDELVEAMPQSLLEACACGKEEAFAKWVGMLNELDVYARKQSVDIRGVKLWMHVFFNGDGSIKHIAYHLRPNSRQIEADVLAPVLEGFARQYRFPVTGDTGFAHYSTGSFPVFGELTGSSN